MSLLWLFLVLLIVSAVAGGWGSYRGGWGYYGWSPFGLVLIIVIVLLLSGALH